MNPNKLQERLTFVKASELPNRASTKTYSRREISTDPIDEKEESSHETFFDFEEELSDMKSSAEQYSDFVNSDPYIVLEEKESDVIENHTETSSIIMEDIGEDAEVSYITMEDVDSAVVKSFEFIRCEQIKADGIRCKRQAKKGQTMCAAHRKMADRINK